MKTIVFTGLGLVAFAAEAAPKAAPGSISVSTTIENKTRDFVCKNPPPDMAADTQAVRGNGVVYPGCVEDKSVLHHVGDVDAALLERRDHLVRLVDVLHRVADISYIMSSIGFQ